MYKRQRDDRDGLPNVVLEAMACGRPVVASDVAAIATAVIDGVTGVLVPAERPRALAGAIDGLAADDVGRARLGRRARLHAERHHGLDGCSAHLVHTLERAYA